MIHHAKIVDLLMGHKIVDVIFDDKQEYNITERGGDNIESLQVDYGKFYILLDNDTVIRCWNSEWGGIELGKIEYKDDIIIWKKLR